jgi:hypothetical protein
MIDNGVNVKQLNRGCTTRLTHESCLKGARTISSRAANPVTVIHSEGGHYAE